MDWKEQIDKATAAIKEFAESEQVKELKEKARQTAVELARVAKQGAREAADAVARATAEPATLRLDYMGAGIRVVSPSDGLQISRPHAGALVLSDGAGNSIVINLAPPRPAVSETLGVVKKLDETTYDLGPEDGLNLVVFKA